MATFKGSSGSNVYPGTDEADSLTSNVGDDTVSGAGGDDAIDGGPGNDIASYTDTLIGVTVSLALPAPQQTHDGVDTLTGIENLTGSNYDDTIGAITARMSSAIAVAAMSRSRIGDASCDRFIHATTSDSTIETTQSSIAMGEDQVTILSTIEPVCGHVRALWQI